MSERFYSDQPITNSTVVLTGSEAHHLLHVMRAQPGLEVTLFDGRGGEYRAHVSRCRRAEVELSVAEHQTIERELPIAIMLGVVLPKGDRQRWLIEKAVELGVCQLVPLTTQRSNRSYRESPAKLTRYVVEASKQCGRNRLMEITNSLDWQTFVAQSSQSQRFVAHPGGKPLQKIENHPTTSVQIAVGPEGGFTDDEIDLARSCNWQVVELGERILRIETAALTLVAGISQRATTDKNVSE